MGQETEERNITQAEFEQLCLKACEWVTPRDAVNLDEDVLWCAICKNLCHLFDRQYFHEDREISAGDDCRNQIKGLVKDKKSAPFDENAIARKYIEDALSKADIE